MGLKEIQILFDNPWATYYVGNSVSGQVVLRLDAPKKVRAISIKIKGEANVKWEEQESYTNSDNKSETRTVAYTSHEKYFENKFNVLSAAGDTTEIPPGTHTYNFSTILPPNLPSSFEGEFGHVRYTVKATLDRPWKFDQECKVAFTVVSPLDLNYSPEAKMPLRQNGEKSVGICCCESGPLSVSVDAPFSGYVSGQQIPLAVEIENMTNRQVTSSQVVLRKVVTFKAVRPVSKTKVQKVDIVKQKLGNLGAHSLNRYQQNILVPALPPSNLNNCSVIDLIYEIKVETSVSGFCARGLDLKCPIIFGTSPITESLNGPPAFSPAVQVAQEIPSAPVGWSTPPPVAPSGSTYPNIPPPSYEECTFGTAKTIMDTEDNEHTQVGGGWAPRYPTYNFAPSAPAFS